MYSFSYLFEYYPESIHTVTEEMLRDRKEVQSFMTGEVSEKLLSAIESSVLEKVNKERIDVVCFAPGTTGAKTILRFGNLAERLSSVLPCDVYLDAITLVSDADPITHERFYQCNKARVFGKKVLVVGSVYTTGKSLKTIGDILIKNKAKSVSGLFVAKTMI